MVGDERYTLNGILFEWNRTKAHQAERKHGVSFEQAAEAFFDPFLIVMDAALEGEARLAVIGMDLQWNLLFVVHIAFGENSIRIISARKATRGERTLYED